jgi:protein TonB
MWYADSAIVRLHQARQQRTLYACIGISIALHTLAMLSFPPSLPAYRPDETRALTALFASRPESELLPTPRKPRERRQAEVPAPLPKPVDPVPVARSPVPEPAPVPASGAQPDAASPVASAAPRADVSAHAPAETSDPALFDAYRLALINAAKRYKRYPVQAMERGWEGRVEIRVVVDANGAIKSALVKTSSRYPVLDDQALDMVRRAFNALVQVQPAPRGREFTVDVPVIFELQTG